MGIFNEIEILNQIGLKERDDLKKVISENIKIKSYKNPVITAFHKARGFVPLLKNIK